LAAMAFFAGMAEAATRVAVVAKKRLRSIRTNYRTGGIKKAAGRICTKYLQLKPAFFIGP
jgi:hypothetical protein